MAINYKMTVWEDPQYMRHGSQGRCPYCGKGVATFKYGKPETPNTNVRVVLVCVSRECGKELRIIDGIDNVLTQNKDLERGG